MLELRGRLLAVMMLLVTLSPEVEAQKKEGQALLDSLMQQLPRMQSDTMAVGLLDNIAFAYSNSDPDEGLRYAEKALALAKKIGWKKGEALAYNDFGNNHLHQAEYAKALDYFYRSLNICEELGLKEVGKVSGNIGTVYFQQKNYDKALEYFFKNLKSARKYLDKESEMIVSGNIGGVYYAQGNFHQALTYMQQALATAEQLGDKRNTINQLNNIGSVYSDMGNKEEAIAWYFKGLSIAERDNDLQFIAVNLGNIGGTYLDLATDTNTLSTTQRRANLDKAISYLQKGIEGSKRVHFNQAVIEFSRELSEAYLLQGNYRASLEAYQQYTTLKDSVFSLENNEKISSLETKRAVELKDKDIRIAELDLAKKRNERWFFIGGILLLLGISGLLFRSFKRQKQSNVLLSTEKKRSDDLLLNILPAEVAEELKQTGSAQAHQYDEVSVLFTDFLNFTETSEQLSPHDLVKELHECFTAFDTIIERNNLEKIKTIGDAYMAVCGLPVSDSQHAINTVKAALEIRDFINNRLSQRQSFKIRIGINSGPVVAGIVGVKKFAYDIWGDTVNTAARMEQHGMHGAINISQSTYELVKESFHCDYRGKIAAKHKGEIEMYFVTSSK